MSNVYKLNLQWMGCLHCVILEGCYASWRLFVSILCEQIKHHFPLCLPNHNFRGSTGLYDTGEVKLTMRLLVLLIFSNLNHIRGAFTVLTPISRNIYFSHQRLWNVIPLIRIKISESVRQIFIHAFISN